MSQFYIQTPAGQEGPFTVAQLISKNITAQTPVWYQGISEWKTAGTIDALRPLFLGAGSPPPFKKTEPPKFDTSTHVKTESKKRFKLSGFQWAGIGIVVIALFMYFSKEGGANPNLNNTELTGNGDIVDSIASADPAEAERQRINAAITAKNMNYRNNWSRYIKAVAGDYKYSTLGGIYNLEAVIQNNTDYPLDEVRVAVNYIKDSGANFKTEYVTIYNIPKNGRAAMPAPDSDRGTSVTIEINTIISRKMHFFYRDDLNVDGKEDPYFSRN
jgi:hypothetical protein